MFLQSLTTFIKRKKNYAEKLASFEIDREPNKDEYKRILDILCEFLMNPRSTEDVAECFPQLLPILISTSISMEKIFFDDGDSLHKLNSVILGKLLCKNQDLLIFVLHYFELNPAPFESIEVDYSPSSKRRNKRKIISFIEVSDYDLVTACYDILCNASMHFKYIWNWSKFYKYLIHEDESVRWIAINCIAVVLGMSESCYLSCTNDFLSKIQQFFIESKEINKNNITFEDTKEIDQIFDVPSVVSIGGILLPVFKKSKCKNDLNLVPVPSTRQNLQNLAFAISSNNCVCLQGAVGSGKTALVEFLAHATGHDAQNFAKVQLGDQTDSKMLLGMYRCTDIPGEFLWQPGILTEAVLSGKWLLLEDIDCAASDVLSVIGQLVETKTLSVPGYRDLIHIKSGFQLFVTRRLISGGTQKSLQMPIQKEWSCVNVESLSKKELVIIVQTLFPVLHTVATRIVDVFLLFSVGNHEDEIEMNNMKNSRQISTRDLIKWCSRAIIDFDVSSPSSALKIFQDSLDVFCCSISNSVQRLNLAIAVAHKLGIVKTKAEFFAEIHKPSVSVHEKCLIVGRAKLEIKKSDKVKLESKNSNFSYTRPSVCLLERIASCIIQKEPVLLVGETGTGKTSCVQYLAQITGHKLIVINMNQQSESTDLLGGYKPVDLKLLILPIREEFEILFRSYFAIEPNLKFLNHIGYCFEERKWKTLTTLMIHSTNAALRRLRASMKNQDEVEILKKWEKVAQKLEKLQSQVQSQYSLAFSFVEGSLIKALKNGDWVLLDEINLATAETLECLSGLLEGSCGSLSLLERGDKEPIKRHKDFAIFACMNPATDVGKKDLPVGLRNRFTEFFVDELTEKSDLQLLISSYLNDLNLPSGKIESIVKFYLNVRKEAETTLLDGTGHKPHYSLRTLCRALNVSAQNPCANALRSLYEAFCLSFLTQLDSNSYPIVHKMIVKAILGDKNASAIIGIPIPRPHGFADNFICFEGYWIPKGDLDPQIPENYILTETVKQNLKDLVRVVSIGKIPVLLQGDTSVGKTSLITYLAKASGHVCVRINNHEHTDLQEYVGTYIADSTGKLVFKEGILVDAMRKGYWIILDELNLAPSDVLEALNRVLDDNRELFIPETQQVVKAHNNFMLFATQNPPGLYGGRKMLSRAFRNRFVELHFDEIPSKELQVILHKRCKMPETYCKQVINVMTELQIRRKSTATFAGKKGFITLRDLFRWAERYHLAPDTGGTLYDWSQHLADEGYLVLSSKVRHPDECLEIIQVLKKHLRRDVDPDALFSLSEKTSTVTKLILESLLSKKIPGFEHLVWTYQMRKMAVLLSKACDFKEPVLLIGETGGGKTTVCQLLSVIKQQELSIVNCHMHTEASDFLGSLRPVREHGENQKLFEWVDGPLVKSMKNGGFFLIDEISLADDSVLERLNSLLEPERKLLIAEKPSSEENATVTAHENFIFVGTMNPGGDYGKKELSPALRNRFTEIWCEGCVSMDDLKCIIEHNLHKEFKKSVSTAIIEFIKWLQSMEIGKKLIVSVRDILTWVNFVNCCENLKIGDAFFHGAALSYIDGLGSGLTAAENSRKLKDFKDSALKFIEQQIQSTLKSELILNYKEFDIEYHKDKFGIHPFYVKKGNEEIPNNIQFAFSSPTTKMNTLKVLRALQLKKPILLEGSPGVGKTSLVSALARASGHHLLRLNLSDQTDISDLFGADLPVEGGKPGEFSWRDGPFLRALKNGDWILLDELNLASQSVLEGLNACLDHRGEIYIPELGMTFIVKSGTRLFGCQNPLRQGGARRGLPKSFLNRFTQVFIDALEQSDLKFILNVQFPELSEDLLDKMIQFNEELSSQIGITWGHSGSPWEMNLRDVTRWCEIMMASFKLSKEKIFNPGNGAQLIYINRMRTNEDKKKIIDIYNRIFSQNDWHLPDLEFPIYLTKEKIFLGDEILDRNDSAIYENNDLLLLREQKIILKGLAQCVNMNWMSILVGGSGTGKSSLVHLLANLTGRKLKSLVVNPAMDTTEILGGFEQTDYDRHLEELLERVEGLLIGILRKNLRKENLDQVAHYHALLENVRHLSKDGNGGETMETTMSSETKLFLRKTEELSRLVSTMKRLEIHRESELLEIEKKLTDLSIAVNKDRCLNAGGKFEWVDSVLVKCLRNGTWLLLDQVNLCSPAILDRLNGLLEPNGALTIGEKGVDENGDVFTVRPHKDFRLFLAMDPRHGEISRAMRNRGVEISIPTPQNHGPLDRLDVVSLLNNCGISNWAHRNSILEIHRSLYENRYRLNEMLQVASFTSRQMSKGFSFDRSLRNSCRELCATFDAGSRHQAWDKIEGILSEGTWGNGERAHFHYDLDALTLRLRDLRTNSRLAIIKQQGFLFKSAVEKLRDDPEKIDLGDLFDEPPITDTKEFLKHLLLDFYERSSIDDLPIRRLWISNIFSKNELDEFGRANECLAKKVENSKLLFESGSDVPLYLVERSTLANNLSIKLYFQLMILDNQSGSRNIGDDEDVIRLEEYSSAVSSGRLSTNLRHETLILKFAEMTEQCRTIVDTILEHGHLPIDGKTCLELRDELKWYKRFAAQGAARLVDRSRGTFFDLREITSSLTVHYKWLIKSLRRLFALLPPSSDPHLLQLLSDFSTRFFHLYKGGDKYRKLRKKVKALLPSIPPPHLSLERISFLEKLRSASRKLEMNEEDSLDPARTRLKIASMRQNLTARDRLTRIWIEDWKMDGRWVEDEEVHRVGESILELRDETFARWREGVELCPVYEFFFLLFAYRFQRRSWDEYYSGDFKGGIWMEDALRMFEGVATIPGRLIGLVAALGEEKRGRRIPGLLHELFNGLEDFTGRSFSAGNLNVFLRCLREKEEEEEGSDDFQTSLVNKSTLCHLLYELFSPDRGEVATFENHERRKKLLLTVRALLWRNSSALNSSQYEVSSNDSALLRSHINYYLSAVDEVVETTELALNEEETDDLANRLLSPANALRGIERRLETRSDAASRGRGWMLLGCVQLFLFADLGPIDPVRKEALRSRYRGENAAELQLSALIERLQSAILGEKRPSTRTDRLNEARFENSADHPVRPPSRLFSSLREEVENFSSNVASFRSTFERMERLNELHSEGETGGSRERLHEAEIWRRSLERFSAKLERNFLPGFPDLVSPILSAVSSLRHGLSILTHHAPRPPTISHELLRFPVAGRCQEDYLNLVKLCSSDQVTDPASRMAKIALMELENLSLAVRSGGETGPLMEQLVRILNGIRIAWREREKRREEEESERESLFRSKGGKREEEEEQEQEFRDMFPDHGSGDFLDFREGVEESSSRGEERRVAGEEETPWRDARIVREIHSSVLRNCCSVAEDRGFEPDFLRPLAQRYELLGRGMKTWPEDISSRLLPALNVVLISRSSSSLKRGETYNFYKNPNVDEVERCRPLFEGLLARIDELASEWPENPLLNSIRTIIDRVFGFPVDSPLSRYLTGVELLLAKMKQWEENARHDVSLAGFIESFGGAVLRWRRLEFSRWNDTLELVEDESRADCSKWWFHLFDLTDEYLANEDGSRKGRLVESLQRFLTESPLIEFEDRLDLIRLFHLHHSHVRLGKEEEQERRKELLAVLWNVHLYYARFADDVRARIKASKEPVARRLRDAIKIARWSDSSYWSVRSTGEKTRRTLHKFAREYRKALAENVAAHLTLKTEGSSSRRGLPCQPSDFLVDPGQDSCSIEIGTRKLGRLGAKARRYCERVISSHDYPRIRGDIEAFIVDCLEESEALRMEKSRSNAQRKRMALANYFKTLATRLGVSYRIGALAWKNRRDEVVNLACAPLDLREIIRGDELFLQAGREGLARGLAEEWADCDRYYYGSMVKLNFLDGILSSGRGGLGARDAERCLGLSAHLALLAHRQKGTIANLLDALLPFHLQVSNLASMTRVQIPEEATMEIPRGIIPAQREFRNAANDFQRLLEVLQISLKQIVVFLESCPTTDGGCLEGGLDLKEARVPMLSDGSVARSAAASMKDCLESIRGIASESNRWISIERRVERSGGGALLSHRGRVEFLEASYRRIDRVKRELAELGRAFTDDHPIVENVRFLIGRIDESNEVFGSARQPSGSRDSREKEYEAKLDALVTQILLVVQKRVQDCWKIGERIGNEGEESRGEENLMTERLVESLEKIVPELRLNTVSRMLGELLEIVHESDVESANDRVRSLLRYLPLLEQYALLLRYYLYEQVACFRLTCKFLYLQLNVFLELAANGFCQPKDEEEAERGEEEGKNVEGGMGLAEGEGREDVSERIESEDQLEGARDPNEERRGEEEGKKDMKEEEKGIEMSEDFEGTMQDIEGRRDEEEEEKEEEDDDIDKEMGETDETADKLDEEIWKDEEEEEEQEEDKSKENEKEERGRGEKTGKEELSAKDEGKDRDRDEETEGERETEGEEKKEINEFEEPEVNEDQIDPYHGKIRPEIEPEPFELPEDVNLDEEGKEDNPEGEEEEDPFDIDQMKESKISEEMDKETEEREDSEEDKRKESDDEEEEEVEEEDSNGDKRKEEKVEKDERRENLEDEKQDEKEEENVEEENTEEDTAPASFDAGSKEVDASQEVESKKDGSRDAVESQSEEQMEINPTENSMESKKDKGTGQSQTEEREGHSGSKQEENVPISGEEVSLKPAPKRRRPGQSDEKRSLPDDDARSSAKKLKTAEIHDRDTEEESEKNKGGGESESYEHIKSSEKHDDYAFDAATEEQIKKQASNLEDKEDKMDDQLEDDDVKMHEDPEPNDREEETKKEQSQKLSESKKEKSANARGERTDDAEQQIEIGGDVEGENVETIRVLRGNESTIHTKLSETELHDVSTDDIARKRSEIESMLGQWSHGPSSIEAANAWNSISAITESAARELSEKLRLVLEPTLTSRLKGDYRTGKRINMRKVIPYIASEFRKDKIWLRRTKPSKRDYQIVLAIDDSSSMADNHSKELAFESLSLIGKAMTYLEVGQLAVVNFGERVNILHPFGENFTEESGARLIQEMKFEQKKTMIGQLLDFTIKMFASQSSSSDNAKLVTILSDGRGIFSEGIETVTTAVRKAKLLNIFLVFIIVDNPLNKDSILDIRMPVFDGGKLLGIRSYMDNFPFPFYIILRDLNSLPVVLSDALRQWFEIVGRIDT